MKYARITRVFSEIKVMRLHMSQILLNYKPYGLSHFGRPVKRQLDEAETCLSRPNWWGMTTTTTTTTTMMIMRLHTEGHFLYGNCQVNRQSTNCASGIYGIGGQTTAKFTHFRGHAVALLVEELRYKPEGRGVDSRWCHFNWLNPSGSTMALGLTQPLTDMRTGNIYGGGGGAKATVA
jgi:hypothetical protein